MVKQIHSYWAYLTLALLILIVINALYGYIAKKDFKSKDYRIGLFTLIAVHIQLLIGLATYYFSDKYAAMKNIGMAKTMKTPELRKIIVEHPIGMLVVMMLVTIGWSLHKSKVMSKSKFKTFILFNTPALLVALYLIPASFWSSIFKF